jgi:ABC-type multidrug transport system ATPase subunit
MTWANLEARHVMVQYPQRGLPAVLAVNDVSFGPVPRGAFVLLRGATGAGKSSLLGALLGRVRACAGEVLVDEIPIALADLRRRIGIVCVPQDPTAGVIGVMTVEENLFVRTLMLAGVGRAEREGMMVKARKALEGLEEWDFLFSRRDSNPRALSGGQQQLVTVASCLMTRADVIVMDEPTSKLDAGRAAAVWAAVERLRVAGTTFLVASHEAAALKFSTAVLTLDGGKIVAQASP